ncbi:NCA2-domain-containing protein [Mycena floridula]|nr:NCA2-domain-containing protein [Mycena floridula]
MSHFGKNYTKRLSVVSVISFEEVESPGTKDQLAGILQALEKTPVSRTVLHDALDAVEQNPGIMPTNSVDAELQRAVTQKLVVALYSEALQLFLDQSSQLEDTAEWWSNIERSKRNVAWYFIQTLPTRALNLLRGVRNTDITKASALRPSFLLTSLFPHLRNESQIFGSRSLFFFSLPRDKPPEGSPMVSRVINACARYLKWVTLPLELTQQECREKRKKLESLRDQRAQILGTLAQQRGSLTYALHQENMDVGRKQVHHHITPFAINLNQTLKLGEPTEKPSENTSLTEAMRSIVRVSLPQCIALHSSQISPLQRPPWFTLLWPKIFLLPLIALVSLRYLYKSRSSLLEMANETINTIKSFLVGWLFEPLKDVWNTVRTGGEDGGVIISKEGVLADLDSLERMTLSFAKDQLRYGADQMDSLSQQIRVGDLTAVLKVYEKDIEHPFKAALMGSLLRSLFIQIQKTKVDIDYALKGIDRLLKSQELTFAFVGVAPALTIVYVIGGYLGRMWTGNQGHGKYGGKFKRAAVMFTMRRIERLLIVDSGEKDVSPLTTGLLMLSVAHLRDYAEVCLPPNSRLLEGFLQDVGDLEAPELGRNEKRMVVERMWRSWGTIFSWSRVAAEEPLR